jgi:hypothetical protein
VSGTGFRSVLENTCDSSCRDHIRMAVVGTTCDDNCRVRLRCQLWGLHAMSVVGTTCDGSCRDHN